MNLNDVNTGKTYEDDKARARAKAISEADKKKVLDFINEKLPRKAGGFFKLSGKGFHNG